MYPRKQSAVDDILPTLSEPWRVLPTGDMTLCVLDAAGIRILRIDMLSHGTMRAGDDGERLARAYNNLSLVAALPNVLRTGVCELSAYLPLIPHPEAGVSPMPWMILSGSANARLVDATERVIARISWKGKPSRSLFHSLRAIELALSKLH